MEILSINSKEFSPYGKILTGYDTAELVQTLSERTPLGDGVKYVASDPVLENLAVKKPIAENAFGGMDIQLGWCNGHNTKLNCLEYHKSSEINIGANDFILLLALVTDIENGRLDTSKVKAFKVPAGVMVEVYSTTLHYAPCSAVKGQGFRVMVALPKGTNAELGSRPDELNDDDKALWAVNKWLLAHSESAEAKQGAQVLLDGNNVDISDII